MCATQCKQRVEWFSLSYSFVFFNFWDEYQFKVYPGRHFDPKKEFRRYKVSCKIDSASMSAMWNRLVLVLIAYACDIIVTSLVVLFHWRTTNYTIADWSGPFEKLFSFKNWAWNLLSIYKVLIFLPYLRVIFRLRECIFLAINKNISYV